MRILRKLLAAGLGFETHVSSSSSVAIRLPVDIGGGHPACLRSRLAEPSLEDDADGGGNLTFFSERGEHLKQPHLDPTGQVTS